MYTELLGVNQEGTLNFFFEHLKDLTSTWKLPDKEVLYNASVLAHFASTSVASSDVFPSLPDRTRQVLRPLCS